MVASYIQLSGKSQVGSDHLSAELHASCDCYDESSNELTCNKVSSGYTGNRLTPVTLLSINLAPVRLT